MIKDFVAKEEDFEKNSLNVLLFLESRSLISAFIVRCLNSIISLDSITEISRLWLASVAAQAGLCLAWSETPEDTFCRVVAQIVWNFVSGS